MCWILAVTSPPTPRCPEWGQQAVEIPRSSKTYQNFHVCSQANRADLNMEYCFKLFSVFCGSHSTLGQRTRKRMAQQPAMNTHLEGGTPLQVTAKTPVGSGTAARVLVSNTMPGVSSSMVIGTILKVMGHSSKSHWIHYDVKIGKKFNPL